MNGKLTKALGRRPELRIVLIFALTYVALAFFVPGSEGAFDLTLARAATDGLVALGLTAVIVQGELDLSVGSVLALGGVVTIGLEGSGLALAIPAAVTAGASIGLGNGLIVTRLHVNSFIATLGTMVAVRGIVLVATGSAPLSGTNIDASLAITDPLLGELTPRMLVLFAAALALYFFMARTRIGRDFYAVGGNRDAAAAVGIPIERRVLLAFVLSGALAGLAGSTLAVELNTGAPGVGSDVVLLAIAAVVIGGTSLTGGRGTALGTMFGVLTLAHISTALNQEGVDSAYQQMVIGAILLAVVVADFGGAGTGLRRLRAALVRGPRASQAPGGP